MINAFWCLDCCRVPALDVHGRCETCQSDSVVSAAPTPAVRQQERAMTTEQLAKEVQVSIQKMSPAEKARVRWAFRPTARTRHWTEVLQ
jgi:hypothetical protein